MGRIEKYGHGGDLLTASEQFGIDPTQIIDFSANINPYASTMEMVRSLIDIDHLIHYPDPDHRKLKQALAQRLGVERECLLIGNGAAECMALVILGLAPGKVGVVYPCFSEYAGLAGQFGAEVHGIYGREEQDFKPDRDELAKLIESVDLVFIGHPNNPTGIVYSRAELEWMAAECESNDTYLIIDEAFLDFLEGSVTLLDDLKQYPHLILIRSMTKFYAIPGLRLGYSVASPELIVRMKGKQVTWSVNSFALAIGEASLQDLELEERTRQQIQIQRDCLVNFLNRIGWKVWPGQANFLLVRLPEGDTTMELQNFLGERGILIRDCSMYPGLTEQDFRIAVLDQESNNRLMQLLTMYVTKRRNV